ncbi:MAG TPA: hypothetical protein PLP07_08470 [Pyrinomonadaceae bacterium]|nr:hypothetical protein [Chloracidobacterium sp.]MBP9934816.1 hypothetical protein [Pyrinomonadaceae bacterium]MBK7803154.1 hypothetical protein [Chloracidobacterium sp.]MBK9438200.1 hypothetical protein [Chloracidobacterium sp.]MBK9767602.1 hypothetical protein [Chloracidobacterium sp.]
MANSNLEMLRIAAMRLGDLVEELVFVGGCTTDLFITDEGSAEIRPTKDVDAIVEATTYAQYIKFSRRLEKAGFRPDTSNNAPLCRWVNQDTTLDVMPLDENTLGFTNIWYKAAFETAQSIKISEALTIKVVTPVYFCATKIDAFRGRGKGDYLGSPDLEDLIAVIDGREELVNEISSSPIDVKNYITEQIRTLLKKRGFTDALAGHLLPDEAGQARIHILLDRLNRISKL